MTAVRTATAGDLDAVCSTLARAFHDDPAMRYLIPDGAAHRERRLGKLMRLEARSSLPQGSVFTTGDRSAAAVWKAPGRWKIHGAEIVRNMPLVLSALRTGARRGLGAVEIMEKAHPTAPHWYLAILGTAPESQGKGLGSAVMAPILDRCDADGAAAYLESSKEQNVPFYERHGFRVTGEVAFPNGGPTLWLMWRDPR